MKNKIFFNLIFYIYLIFSFRKVLRQFLPSVIYYYNLKYQNLVLLLDKAKQNLLFFHKVPFPYNLNNKKIL